jgi:tetratricopeptide (TPR) repeat protein
MLPILTIEHGVVDLSARTFAPRAGGAVSLTDVEARLLGFLAGLDGRAGAREVLLREVWGYHARVVSRTVDTAIYRLRQKIEPDPAAPTQLLTVPGGWALRLAPAPAPTDWVSRPALWAALREAVGEGAVLTLAGPGGAGKTTLLRALAAERGAPVARLEGRSTGPELVAGIAAALGLTAVDDAIGLGRALAARGAPLLLLDDLDAGVAAARGLLAAIRTAAPRTCWVATSRERLAVAGERVIAVEGMAPDEARALLRARSPADAPGWDDPEAVERVLAAVDRLPLAVTWVAGWVDVLSAPALLRRLDRQLDLLRGTEGGEPRHGDLRAVVAASWALLGPQERHGLRALAVFAGDFTVGDAEALSTDAPHWIRALARRSLLQRDGEAWRLFAAVRAFAREQGAPDGILERHRAALTARAAAWQAALEGPGRAAALAEAWRRRADLDEGFAVAAAARDPAVKALAAVSAALPGHGDDQAARLSTALSVVGDDAELLVALAVAHRSRARVAEARSAVARARAVATGRFAVEALAVEGVIERDHGDGERGAALLDEALAGARALGDAAVLGRVLVDQAWSSASRGRTGPAEAAYREALSLLPPGGSGRRAAALANLANLHRETGRDPLPLLHEALAEHQRSLHRLGESIVSGAIASALTERGDLDAAAAWFDRALAGLRAVGQRHAELVFTLNRSVMLRMRGSLAEARADLEAAAAGLAALGDDRMASFVWGTRGEQAEAEGDGATAARCYEAAVAAASASGRARDLGVYGGFLATARHRAGDTDGARAALDAAVAVLRQGGFRDELARAELRRAAWLTGDERTAHLATWAPAVTPTSPRWLRDALAAATR